MYLQYAHARPHTNILPVIANSPVSVSPHVFSLCHQAYHNDVDLQFVAVISFSSLQQEGKYFSHPSSFTCLNRYHNCILSLTEIFTRPEATRIEHRSRLPCSLQLSSDVVVRLVHKYQSLPISSGAVPSISVNYLPHSVLSAQSSLSFAVSQ